MEPRLVEIRSKLDRLRAVDEKRLVFGALRDGGHGHGYEESPVLDARGIADLATSCGAALPGELRAFLENVHGGGAGPGYGFHVWGEPRRAARPFPYGAADLADLISRRREDRYASLPMPEDDDDDDESWPPGPGFIALAHHGCGVYDVIVATGELCGTIWCCDMAWRPHTKEGRPLGFLDWYEAWLDRNLSPQSLACLRSP